MTGVQTCALPISHTEADELAAEVLWGYIYGRDVATACQAWLEAAAQGFLPFNIAAEDACAETPPRQLLEIGRPPRWERV